jgi:hypothetical protein
MNNIESKTASLLMRTAQEQKQPANPRLTTDNHRAFLRVSEQVNSKVTQWQSEIDGTLRDTTLTAEGRQKKFHAMVERIMKEVAPLVAKPLDEVKGAMKRLPHLMFDPITAKPPKGDPMVTFLREQELRGRIPKDDASKAYLLALEKDDLETARAILDAPGAPWITADIRRRGEEDYAKRTNPAAWAQFQSLDYYQQHLESLAEQVRGWFLALGATPESVQSVLGD